MIKVLFVAGTLALGGVGEMMIKLSKAASELSGGEVVIDFASGDPVYERYREAIEDGGGKLFRTEKKRNIFSYVRKISEIVRDGRYDIVHVHGSSNLIAPELLGARMGGCGRRIAHSHNTWTSNHILHSMARPLFNALYTDAVACGDAAGRWMFGDKPFIVIKNGIDIGRFRFDKGIRDEVRAELGVGDAALIGHVGSFNHQKNHELLIKIFDRYLKDDPGARLLLVGDGYTRGDVKAQAERLGISDKVIFYGISGEVEKLMMAMDIFVLPSRFEGLPLVLVEAQASGLPCVVSSRVSEEARLGSAYISVDEYDDLGKWCGAMGQALALSDREERSADAVRNMAELGYSMDDSGSQLLSLYGVKPRERAE